MFNLNILDVPVYEVQGGGDFVEKEHGKRFFYISSPVESYYPFPKEWRQAFPDVIQIGSKAGELRACKVKKTVAYVVIDENGGFPIIEKWNLKQNNAWKGRDV